MPDAGAVQRVSASRATFGGEGDQCRASRTCSSRGKRAEAHVVDHGPRFSPVPELLATSPKHHDEQHQRFGERRLGRRGRARTDTAGSSRSIPADDHPRAGCLNPSQTFVFHRAARRAGKRPCRRWKRSHARRTGRLTMFADTGRTLAQYNIANVADLRAGPGLHGGDAIYPLLSRWRTPSA